MAAGLAVAAVIVVVIAVVLAATANDNTPWVHDWAARLLFLRTTFFASNARPLRGEAEADAQDAYNRPLFEGLHYLRERWGSCSARRKHSKASYSWRSVLGSSRASTASGVSAPPSSSSLPSSSAAPGSSNKATGAAATSLPASSLAAGEPGSQLEVPDAASGSSVVPSYAQLKKAGGARLPAAAAPREAPHVPLEYWAFDVLDPAHLVTSYWAPPLLLLLLHVVTSLLLMASLLVTNFAEGGLGAWWLTYFTHWGLALLTLASLVACANIGRNLPVLVASAPRVDSSPSRTNWGSALLPDLLLVPAAGKAPAPAGQAPGVGVSSGGDGAAAGFAARGSGGNDGRAAAAEPAGPAGEGGQVDVEQQQGGTAGGPGPKEPGGQQQQQVQGERDSYEEKRRAGEAEQQPQQQQRPGAPAKPAAGAAAPPWGSTAWYMASGRSDWREAWERQQRAAGKAVDDDYYFDGGGNGNGGRDGGGGAKGGGAKGGGLGDVEAGAPGQEQPQPHTQQQLVERFVPRRLKWDWLSVAHLLLMETAVISALFITVFYWVGLVAVTSEETDLGSQPSTFLKHAVNTVLSLAVVFFTRLPIVSYHYVLPALFCALYAVFAWLYGGIGGTWRYGLNWETVRGVLMVLLLPLLLLLIFMVWYWIARLRERLGRRRVARVGTFAFTDDIAEQFDAAAAGPVVPGTGTGDAPPPQ